MQILTLAIISRDPSDEALQIGQIRAVRKLVR